MTTEYRGSYRDPEEPDRGATTSWDLADVAVALEGLISTVADFGFVVEQAVADAGRDLISVTVFDVRRRAHRMYDARGIVATYSQGFDPPLTANGAAHLIALEIASSP